MGAGVAHVAVGDRVFATATASGAYAQFALCAAEHVHALPAGVTSAQGASLNVAYRTAYRALFQKTHPQPGQWVLVHGATGGVGLAAVQLGLAAGFRVIGSAGTAEGAALLRAQGVEHGARAALVPASRRRSPPGPAGRQWSATARAGIWRRWSP